MSAATGFLQEIGRLTRERVEAARSRLSLAELRARVADLPAPRGFEAALRAATGLGVIAEFKRASPSRGPIADLDPASQAQAYARAGATCVSVLTEPTFFGARPGDLETVRSACALPVLRKDFLLDPYQVLETRLMGADAALVIVRLVGERLGELVAAVRAQGLDALVEVHEPEELERAVAAGATMIGVNARNLDTLATDVAVVTAMLPRIPPGVVRVAESGIRDAAAGAALRRAGADAILVGERLMRSDAGELIAVWRQST